MSAPAYTSAKPAYSSTVPEYTSARSEYSSPESRVTLAVLELRLAIDTITEVLANDAAFEISTETLQCLQHELRAIEDRIHAARLTVLPVIEQAGLWACGPCAPGSFATWLVNTDDIARATANREIKDATKLRDHLPATRAAALAGDVGAGQVEALLRFATTSQARCVALQTPIADTCENNSAEPDCPDDQTTERDAAEYDSTEHDVAAANTAEPPTGEAFLLGFADAYPLGQFRRLVKRFAHVADPDADERGYIEAEEREYLNLSPTMGGWDVRGFLAQEHGHQLATALAAVTYNPTANSTNITTPENPSCLSPSVTGPSVECPAQPGVSRPQTDVCTPAQKRAAALADLARLAMDTGLLGGGAIERRQMVVNISWTEFCRVLKHQCKDGTPRDGTTSHAPFSEAALFGESSSDHGYADCNTAQINPEAVLDPDLDFATWASDPADEASHNPIPASVLKRIACDCDIRRVIFGPEAQVLDVGRTYRVVPSHIRTAVIARDRNCTYPGCDQPPERCEVHHAIRHWADGGETSTQNAALLCWHHHKVVDTTGITMRPAKLSNQRPKPGNQTTQGDETRTNYWQFHDRHGQEIHV